MSHLASGFTAAQIDNPSIITATVIGWNETAKPPRQGKSGFPRENSYQPGEYCLGSAAAVWAGRGRVGYLWVSGHTDLQVTMIGEGVKRLLDLTPPGVKLQVWAIPALQEYVGQQGYVRAAIDRGGLNRKGLPFPAYPLMKEIALARDAGRWSFQALPQGAKDPATKEATRLAKGPAYDAALQHLRQDAPSDPSARWNPPPKYSVTEEGSGS